MKLGKIIIIILIAALFFGVSYLIYGYFSSRQTVKNINPDQLYEITAQDPLFYSPNINVEKLEKAVANLKKEETEYRDLALKNYLYWLKNNKINPHTYSPDDTYAAYAVYYDNYEELIDDPARTFLHPIGFLEQFIEVQKSTAMFLKNKDAESGLKMISDYEKSAIAYKKSINEQTASLEKMIAKVPRFLYGLSLATKTKPELTFSDFQLVQKNAEALQKEISERKKCLLEGICSGTSIMGRKSSPIQKPAISSLPLVPDGLLEKTVQIVPKSGPYRIATGCFGSQNGKREPEQLIYLLLRMPAGWDEPIFTPKLATENFYRDLKFSDAEIDKKIIASGRLFQFVSDGESYTCPDLEYWGNLSLAASGDELAYLPEMINALTDNVFGIKAFVFLRYPIHLDALAALQSNYSIVYFPFTERVWRIGEKPVYFETAPLRFDYKTLTELKKSFSNEKIKFFHFGLTAEREKILKAENKKPSYFQRIIYGLPLKIIRLLPIKIPPPFA